MNITYGVLEHLMEVSDIFAATSKDLSAKLEDLTSKLLDGQVTAAGFANEFNGLRTDLVVDHGAGEFADYLLEVEEAFERGHFLP